MHLDFQTLYGVAAISLLATGAIIGLAARSYSNELARIGYLWAMAVGFATLSYTFVALRGSVPDTVSILGGNATGVAATSSFLHACLRLARRKTPLLLIYLPVVLATISAAYFAFEVPNLSVRAAIFSALAALQMGLCAALLARPRGIPRSLASIIGSCIFCAGSIVLVLRAAVRLTQDPSLSLRANFASSSFEQGSILLTFVIFMVLSQLFLIISSDQLSLDLKRLATLDPLTERFNRRAIEGLGRREVANARRQRSPVAVALLDIDHFKEINDRHGHAAGDTAMRAAAVILEQNLRPRDILGRYGGDELIVVMPNTDVEQAAAACERLRELLARSQVTYESAEVTLTVSAGVACMWGEGADFDRLVRAADSALYEAKRQGRNRICMAGQLVRGEKRFA